MRAALAVASTGCRLDTPGHGGATVALPRRLAGDRRAPDRGRLQGEPPTVLSWHAGQPCPVPTPCSSAFAGAPGCRRRPGRPGLPYYPAIVTRLIAVEPSRRRRGRARTAAGQARTQVEIVPGTAEDLPGQDSWTPRSTRPWPGLPLQPRYRCGHPPGRVQDRARGPDRRPRSPARTIRPAHPRHSQARLNHPELPDAFWRHRVLRRWPNSGT